MAKRRFDGEQDMSELGNVSEDSMINFGLFGDGDDDINIFGESKKLFSQDDVISYVDPTELIPYDGNPMNMDEDDNWKALKLSIQETGIWKENPIVAEIREDGKKMVLAGHRRTTIAIQLKLESVPVIYKKFANEEERKRFIDASNIYRDPKLIDILNRYEFNAELYDQGYWDDKEIGKKGRHNCVSMVIGYSPSKMKNLKFLLDIKKTHEQIIHLIDEDVIIINDLRKLNQMHSTDKIYNYVDILDELCRDEYINNSEEPLRERKKRAKLIFKKVEMKGRNKSNIKSEKSTYDKVISISNLVDKAFEEETLPDTSEEKANTITVIDEIMEKLSIYKEKINSLD